jgi:adenylate cyclase
VTTPSEIDSVYRFGDFRLDTRRQLLHAGPDAQAVALTSKAFAALAHLVRHRDQIVSKAELMQAVWPDVVVEENNLNQVITALRRTFGEKRGEQRFIVTVPGRGYRFVAEVRAETRDSGAVIGATEGAHPLSIAVLPFVNLTGEADKEYFGDGMAEELIHKLSRVAGLRVPARTSSFAYKGRNAHVRDIARELNVSSVLEGSLRSAGERIRVTAQLVDGKSGFQRWSETFDRRLDDIFALQDELTAAIVKAVSREQGAAALPSVVTVPPTRDVQAYQLYLQGIALAARASVPNFKRAAELFGQAIARDPYFARAMCADGIVNLDLAMYFNSGSLAGALPRCEERARQALALDPSLAEAEALLGFVAAHRLRWVQAEQHYRRSFALGTDAQVLLTHGFAVSASAGHLAQGRRTLEQALSLAPGNPAVAMQAAVLQSFQGHDEQALRLAALAETLGWPAHQMPLPIVRSQGARRAGDFAEAVRQMMLIFPEAALQAGIADLVRGFFAALGNTSQRSKTLDAIRATAEQRSELAVASPALTMILVHWAVMLGDVDLAFGIGHRALDRFERDGAIPVLGFIPQLWVLELEPFRRDRRFPELVQRLKLMDYWAEYGAPDGCELRAGRLVVG